MGRNIKLFFAAAMGLFPLAHMAFAQNWTPVNVPTNGWQCIASSADGSRLIAGTSGGFVYLSTNSGTSWTPTLVTNEYWSSVASSADGGKLVAVAANNSGGYSGGVFTSTNAGTSWASNSLPSMYWASVASSADGNTLAVVAPFSQNPGLGGAIFSSTNAGTSWTSNTLNNAVGVVVSADGSRMAAVAQGNFLRSTNYGVTWTPDTHAPLLSSYTSPSQFLAGSADGTRLVLCVPSVGDLENLSPGPIYVSTDSGDTWNLTSAPSNFWGFVTSSADGKTIVAVRNFGQYSAICLSTDFGNTWNTNTPVSDWTALASSADGGKLAAVAADDGNPTNQGTIYVSQSIVSPVMFATPGNGSVKLSWLVPSANFVAQQSSDLLAWQNITNNPTLNLNNLQEEITLPSTNRNSFYRLRTP
jgi:hypothetical protein